MFRFVAYDVDMFGEPNFVGQLTLPVKCVLSGYRSVPLKNGFSEDLDLAALLVHVTRRSALNESSEMVRLREDLNELQRRSEAEESLGDEDAADRLRQEAQSKGRDVMKLLSRRSIR